MRIKIPITIEDEANLHDAIEYMNRKIKSGININRDQPIEIGISGPTYSKGCERPYIGRKSSNS